jgi:tetratricopeptide (TPR) repeat protein
MNAESFANLLKEYAHLYQLPMEELRTMVMQYPYCHNLQVLLQEKAELDQHPDREKNLAKAATYAIDRKQLYKRLKLMREKKAEPKAEASYHLGEDFLELKDLTSVQADLEKIALGTYEDPSVVQTMAIEPEPPSSIDGPASTEPGLNSSWNGSWDGANDDLDEDISLETDSLDFTLNPISNPAASAASDIAVEFEAPLNDVSDSPTPSPIPDPEPLTPTLSHSHPNPFAPTPKKSFSSWSKAAQSAYLQNSIQQLLKEEHLDSKKNKHIDSVDSKNEVSKKAWQSIVDGDSMASETWAQLLLAQKQYHKAIEVYERLMLLIPEKSSFFAAQIESIKNSLS